MCTISSSRNLLYADNLVEEANKLMKFSLFASFFEKIYFKLMFY